MATLLQGYAGIWEVQKRNTDKHSLSNLLMGEMHDLEYVIARLIAECIYEGDKLHEEKLSAICLPECIMSANYLRMAST